MKLYEGDGIAKKTAHFFFFWGILSNYWTHQGRNGLLNDILCLALNLELDIEEEN